MLGEKPDRVSKARGRAGGWTQLMVKRCSVFQDRGMPVGTTGIVVSVGANRKDSTLVGESHVMLDVIHRCLLGICQRGVVGGAKERQYGAWAGLPAACFQAV